MKLLHFILDTVRECSTLSRISLLLLYSPLRPSPLLGSTSFIIIVIIVILVNKVLNQHYILYFNYVRRPRSDLSYNTIKILFPNIQNPGKHKIEEISQRLSWHKLGNIASDKLCQYEDKLWDPKKPSNSGALNLSHQQQQSISKGQQNQSRIISK